MSILESHPQGIKTCTSEENIPTGYHALLELAHEQPSQTLDDAGQTAVVQLFANLQFAHEYSAKVAKAVAKLGQSPPLASSALL